MPPKSRKLPTWFLNQSANTKGTSKCKNNILHRKKKEVGDPIKRTIYCMSPEEFKQYAENLLREIVNENEDDLKKPDDILKPDVMECKSENKAMNVVSTKCVHLNALEGCKFCRITDEIDDSLSISSDTHEAVNEECKEGVSSNQVKQKIVVQNIDDFSFIPEKSDVTFHPVEANGHLKLQVGSDGKLEKIDFPDESKIVHNNDDNLLIGNIIPSSLQTEIKTSEITQSVHIVKDESLDTSGTTDLVLDHTPVCQVPKDTVKEMIFSLEENSLEDNAAPITTFSSTADTVPITMTSSHANFSILDELM